MKQLLWLLVAPPMLAGCWQPIEDGCGKMGPPSQLKQVVTSQAIYLADHDDRFPLASANYVEAMYPYVKNRNLFIVETERGQKAPIRFNRNLSGVLYSQIQRPEKTPAAFSAIVFSFEDKPATGMYLGNADSSAKFLGLEKLAEYQWNPFGTAFPNGFKK